MAIKVPFSIPVILCLAAGLVSSRAEVTAFTYQGRLNDGQGPADGSYDLKFTIFDSGTNGAQQGPVLTNSATAVTNGLFTVMLDFGNQFPGASRWLEIGVRTNDDGTGNFTILTPRQLLTAAPYSIMSANVAAGGIAAGVYTNAVIFANANNQFSGNGAGLTNLSGAKVAGLGALAFSNTIVLPGDVVTNLDTTTIFRLTMFTAGYGNGTINNEAYSTNGVEMFVGSSPTNLVLACNTPIYPLVSFL